MTQRNVNLDVRKIDVLKNQCVLFFIKETLMLHC
jgi:hypothetical protein